MCLSASSTDELILGAGLETLKGPYDSSNDSLCDSMSSTTEYDTDSVPVAVDSTMASNHGEAAPDGLFEEVCGSSSSKETHSGSREDVRI